MTQEFEYATTYCTVPLTNQDGEPRTVTPRPPKGQGWRLVSSAADSGTLAWTWQREMPETVQPDIDQLLTQRVLDL